MRPAKGSAVVLNTYDEARPLSATGRFASIGARLHRCERGGMEVGAEADVENYQSEADDRADAAARAFVFLADLVAYEAQQFREEDRGNQDGDDPGIDAG